MRKNSFAFMFLFYVILISACTDEKFTFIEAESCSILNNSCMYRDNNLSGHYGVSWVEHEGDGVAFKSPCHGKYVSLRYASEDPGSLTVLIDGKESGKLQLASTGSFDKKYAFASSRLDIPENSKVEIIRQTSGLSISMDFLIVHNHELRKTPAVDDRKAESEIYEWHGFKIEQPKISNSASGEAVPVFLLYPKNVMDKVPVVLLLHGITGRKEEWLAFNNFCSGGNLSRLLLERGYAVAVMDLPMHGERKTHEFGNFNDNMKFIVGKWENVYKTGMQDIQLVLENLKHDPAIDSEKTAVLGYSMGGVFVFATAAEYPYCVKTVISCVPPVNGIKYRYKDPYSFAAEIVSASILMITGANDPVSVLSDSQATFERIVSRNKKFVIKNSGHSLSPYASDVLDWLELMLK